MARIGDIAPGYEWDETTDLESMPVWFQDTPHCVPAWVPMYCWFWHQCIHHGMQYAAEKLCTPTHKGLTWRHLRGSGYMSVPIVKDQDEVKRRQPKFRESLRPFIEDYGKVWDAYMAEITAIYDPLKTLDLDKASNMELREQFEATVNMYYKMWEIHWLVMYPVYYAYGLLENTCTELFGIDDTSPEFLALVKGFDNKAFQIDKRLWELSQSATEAGLKDMFLSHEAEHIVLKLGETETGRKWFQEFQEFLEEDGWRGNRMNDILEPSWREEPAIPITNVQHFLRDGGGFHLDAKREESRQERERTIEELLTKTPETHKDAFKTLVRAGEAVGRLIEEHASYLDLPSCAIIRHTCMGIGRRFVQLGAIDQAKDILFLTGDEVRMAILNPDLWNLRHIVRQRRNDWEEWCREPGPPVLMKPGLSPQDAVQFLLSSGDPAVTKIAIGRGAKAPDPRKQADLYGSGGSPGTAEGPARFISDYKELRDVQPGEILVAPATASTWTMVFSMIKGVVVAAGGSLAHAAIVGREYGIPVVLNVYDGIYKIKTGQRIRIDGDSGLVYFLDK